MYISSIYSYFLGYLHLKIYTHWLLIFTFGVSIGQQTLANARKLLPLKQ